MAKRPIFYANREGIPFIYENDIEFSYYSGFSFSQKQKSIISLHERIKDEYPDKSILEVSTKSLNKLGSKLSAFNLLYKAINHSKAYSVENHFQSSKVFKNAGPFLDLLSVTPLEAKRDERIKNSGELIYFLFNGDGSQWNLEPKTAFYDWLYISALAQNEDLSNEVCKYDIFTDIEFNPKKSFNCQARALALFVSLKANGLVKKFINEKGNINNLYKKEFVQNQLF